MQNHSFGPLDDLGAEEVASGAVVDTAGCEGVLFIAVFDAAAGTNKMALEVGAESDGSDHAVVNDSKDRDVVAEVTMNANATVGLLQHHKPDQRYCNVVLTGAGTMVALKYGHRKIPTAQDIAKAVGASFVSPYAAS